jgi:hypothetical protein
MWNSCILYEPSLFADFLAKEGIEQLIMTGLLYCKEESIRQSFKDTMSDVAKCLLQVGDIEVAYGFFLRLLSKHFQEISDYPCR